MSNFDPKAPPYSPPGGPYNFEEVLMASTSLSASTAIAVNNFTGRGLYAFMNITSAFPGSGSTTYTLKIKLVPPNATASAVTLCAAPARSASGMVVLCVYPGAVVGSASATTGITHCGFPLPRSFQVIASASFGATSKEVVMSLGMTIIL
jgi:hypothetical protein